MKRAWGVLAIAGATAVACSSSVTGTGSSSSSSGASGTASSSGASSSGSSGMKCGVTLYIEDQNCEPLFEQSCCAEGKTCFSDVTCQGVAFCRANCTSASGVCGCGTSDTKGYGAALEACIRANLPPACQLR